MEPPPGAVYLDDVADLNALMVYWALSDVLPGLHLIAFAPASWPEYELALLPRQGAGQTCSVLDGSDTNR